MKYIIYCRKSTDTEDKQVLSLDSQFKELSQIVNKQNLDVVDVLTESKSAKEPGRLVFNEMLKMINSGRADAILCWKIDRLTRNPVDGGQIQWLLQNNKIKCIQTFEKTYYPNDNVLLMSIEQAMASQYIRDLSVNVKRGNREKLARGEWPNHAPLGYLNDKATKKIIVDKTKVKYIKRVYELHLKSKSLKEISDILYSEGFRTNSGNKVFKNQIYRIIKNPFYSGIMVREGKYYNGNHEALISKTTFDEAQNFSSNRSRPKLNTLFFPLRGFLKCESCGCSLTASLKKGHHYYYCTNGRGNCEEHKRYLREVFLYMHIGEILAKLSLSERKIELMYQSAKEKIGMDTTYFDNTLETLQKALESLETRESKLLDVFLAEQISKEIYDLKIKEIQNEKILISKQIEETKSRQPSSTLEPIKNIFLQANKARKSFLDADDTKKREILENLLWNLSYKNRNVVEIKLKSPYDILFKMPKNTSFTKMLPYWDEVGTTLSQF